MVPLEQEPLSHLWTVAPTRRSLGDVAGMAERPEIRKVELVAAILDLHDMVDLGGRVGAPIRGAAEAIAL